MIDLIIFVSLFNSFNRHILSSVRHMNVVILVLYWGKYIRIQKIPTILYLFYYRAEINSIIFPMKKKYLMCFLWFGNVMLVRFLILIKYFNKKNNTNFESEAFCKLIQLTWYLPFFAKNRQKYFYLQT